MLQRPSGEEVDRLYPARALDLGKDGQVTVKCEVALTQILENCIVVTEEPKDYGFGRAALTLAHQFRVSPPTADGVAIRGSKISIPFNFKIWGGRGADRRPLSPPAAIPLARPAPFAGVPPPSFPLAAPPPPLPAPAPKLVRTEQALWAPLGFAGLVLLTLIVAVVWPPPRPRAAPRRYV